MATSRCDRELQTLDATHPRIGYLSRCLMKSPEKNTIYPVATNANVSSEILARGGFPVKNPIRAYAYETNWWTRVRGRKRERERDKEKERRTLTGEGNVLLPIFNQLDPNTRTTSQAYFSFYLFSWFSMTGRYHVSVRCLTIAAALCGDHSPDRPFFFFVYVLVPDGRGRTRNIRWPEFPVHLFLAFAKISHAGPVIARGVNYSRDANATPIVIDNVDLALSRYSCRLDVDCQRCRNRPTLLSPVIICD